MSRIALSGNLSGTGTFTIASPNSNTDRTLNLPDAGGTVVVTGTTPALNGITFPASQVPSASANTLDDYEEGTWTPTLTFGGGATGITYSGRGGRYTKIGDLVTVSGFLFLSSKGSSTGTAVIGNVPFTASTGFANPAAIYGDRMNAYQAYVTDETTVLGFYAPPSGPGTTVVAITDAGFLSSTYLSFTISYRTTA